MALMKRSLVLNGISSLLISTLLCAACSLPQSKPKPVYYYTLDDTALELHTEQVLPVVIRVERFTADPLYDTQRIIYGDKGLHRNTYANFRWVSLPAELLAFGLARDLQQCGGFQAVLTPNAPSPPTHTINGFVEEVLEEDYTEPAQASLRLSITLIDDRQPDPVRRILLQKAYNAKTPCEDKTPAALAQAMSASAAKINVEIIHDIYQRLATGQ